MGQLRHLLSWKATLGWVVKKKQQNVGVVVTYAVQKGVFGVCVCVHACVKLTRRRRLPAQRNL